MSSWGRIVEEPVAALLKKDTCMPLICTEGPRFFLDGSGCMNPMRSDFCPAWSVAALPKPEDEPKEAEPAGSATKKAKKGGKEKQDMR